MMLVIYKIERLILRQHVIIVSHFCFVIYIITTALSYACIIKVMSLKEIQVLHIRRV